ncbi:hypothetical protein EVAR_98172_1 [Eumeta japonica]|uniref:Uncharacterized protein n=1 Tax=Eumeta variegata TaxID=151549 RepID=A0A4C1YKC2_EUMVA|nr:hypothetical protein EVAR_98172_1 [Eumeta japonica]
MTHFDILQLVVSETRGSVSRFIYFCRRRCSGDIKRFAVSPHFRPYAPEGRGRDRSQAAPPLRRSRPCGCKFNENRQKVTRGPVYADERPPHKLARTPRLQPRTLNTPQLRLPLSRDEFRPSTRNN